MLVCLMVLFTASCWCPLVKGDGDYLLDPERFSQFLRDFTEKELAVEEFQKYFDNDVNYIAVPVNGDAIADELALRFGEKFGAAIQSVNNIRDALEKDYTEFTNVSNIPECCSVQLDGMDNRFLREVNLNEMCIYGRVLNNDDPKKYATSTVLSVMKNNSQEWPTFKFQYFGTEDGVTTTYPAKRVCSDTYDPRFRPWYSEGASMGQKDIVIALDRSGSMSYMADQRGSETRMEVAIEASLAIIETLNPNDRMGVVAFSNDAGTMFVSHDECYMTELAKASSWNKKYFTDYIIGLYPVGSSNYTEALIKSFSFFRDSSSTTDKVIFFISDGRALSSKENAMDAIFAENRKLNNSIRLLTYEISDAVSENSILREMAAQNISHPSLGSVPIGFYTRISDAHDLKSNIGNYYAHLSSQTNMTGNVIFTVPYLDSFGQGLITSACAPLKHNFQLFGVTCIDILVSDLLGSVSDFNLGARSYGFVMDAESRLLLHPYLPEPSSTQDISLFLQMQILETAGENAEFVRRSMLKRESGQLSFDSRRLTSRGDPHMDGVIVSYHPSTYYWRPVNGTSFSVCVVVVQGNAKTKIIADYYDTTFKYHRVDLLQPKPQLCNLYGYPATYDSSVVKFAPKAFVNPRVYRDLEDTETSVKNYTSYMTGPTENNTYFKEGIRETVAVTQVFDEKVKNVNVTLVRKYLATEDGVFRVIPGMSMANEYDHTMSYWYRKTVANIGEITLIIPDDDIYGAGSVITIGHTLYEGRETGVHNKGDVHVGVLGMDIRLDEFSYLFHQQYPVCSEEEYTCFVLDGSGYLVLHPTFLEADFEADPVHIIEEEETIAEQFIKLGIMKPGGCIDYGSIRNYSHWRLLLPKHTAFYTYEFEIHEVPYTNVFLGVRKVPKTIEPTCTKQCVEHRTCGDRNVCSCPCYSPALYDYCSDKFSRGERSRAPCPPTTPSVELRINRTEFHRMAKLEPNCEVINCSSLTERQCDMYRDCYWGMDLESQRHIPQCIDQEIEEDGNLGEKIIIVATIVCISVFILVLALTWNGIRNKCC